MKSFRKGKKNGEAMKEVKEVEDIGADDFFSVPSTDICDYMNTKKKKAEENQVSS